MRARFTRAAFTATLLLGSVGIARAGEGDTFFADLNGPGAPASGGPAARPANVPAGAPASASAHRAGATASAFFDPLAMDALLDAGEAEQGRDARVIKATAPVAAPQAPSTAAPADGAADVRARVLAPTPVPLAAPAPRSAAVAAPAGTAGKGTVPGRSDPDPEPDAAIKPPPATPSSDPLDAPKGTGGAASVAPPAQPLPPLNAAIKAALDARDAVEIRGANARERRKEREAIAFFYAARAFAPLWSDGGKPVAATDAVLARLAHADEDALTLPAPPRATTAEGTADAVAASEVALTDAVVAYARQATGSRVDPRSIGPLIGAKPELADPAEVLEAVVAAGPGAGDTLRAFNPGEPRYVALREKLAELRRARTRSAQVIPAGPALKVGMRDPRVPLVRARFAVATDAADALDYDATVAAAVADFQRANGLPATGELNKRTMAILSRPQPARLEGTLIANMEMWRWMPRDLGVDRIEVDVPAFTVTVFHDGEPAAHNRVVVGKLDTPTPLFSNTMKFLIVNPVWNVPDSIINKEMLPKGGGDPDYMREHGYDVSYRNGKLVVKQPAGEKNALGRVKFMFPNDYSVYLHDTPSKALFSTAKRAYSHGCVRVDQPFEFAESVLNDGVANGGKVSWSQERLHKLLGDKERYVNLPKPLPIHIEYFTATIDRDSRRLLLRDDVYDYARKVALALGQDVKGEAPGEAVGGVAHPALASAHHHPRAVASQ